MSLRLGSWLIVGCLFLAFGCSGAQGTVTPVPDAGVVVNPFHLAPEPDTALQVERSGTGLFAFAYRDENNEPIRGATVRFAIVGHANDASLLNTDSVTDENGLASGSFVGSSTESSFQIRATAPSADAAFLDVSVSNAGFGALEVELSYEGTRPITEYGLRLYSGRSCADVQPTTVQDRDERMRRSDSSITFETLPAGVSYAIEVHGMDRDRVVLATACHDAITIVANETQSLHITVEDTAAHAGGVYQVRFTVNAAAPGQRVYDQIQASSTGFYTDDSARYLLDQVDVLLALSSDTEAVARWQAYRASAYLDTMFESYFSEHATGPAYALLSLGALANDGVSHMTLVGNLSVPDTGEIQRDALMFSAFDVRFEGVAVPLATTTVALPSALSQGRYSSTQGALVVDSIDFELPLGSLARAYVEAATGDELRAAMIEAAHCEVLADWWDASGFDATACDATTLASACERSIENIADAALVRLANLDLSQRALHLQGLLTVHDSNHDGEVDTLGENSLAGIWRPVGASMGIPADMRVVGARNVPRRASAFP